MCYSREQYRMEDEAHRRRDREERQRREAIKTRSTDKPQRDRDRKLVRS